jgi:hypothetical protein
MLINLMVKVKNKANKENIEKKIDFGAILILVKIMSNKTVINGFIRILQERKEARNKQKEIDEERMNEEIMNMISKTTIIPQTNYITPSVMSPRIVETFDVPIWQKQGKINVIDVLPTSLSRQYSFIESRNPVNKTVNKTVSNGIQNNTSRKTAATKRKEVALNKQKNTQENHKVRKITKTTTIRKELIYACVERYYYDNFAKKSC